MIGCIYSYISMVLIDLVMCRYQGFSGPTIVNNKLVLLSECIKNRTCMYIKGRGWGGGGGGGSIMTRLLFCVLRPILLTQALNYIHGLNYSVY